jgi:hypothetical protein
MRIVETVAAGTLMCAAFAGALIACGGTSEPDVHAKGWGAVDWNAVPADGTQGTATSASASGGAADDAGPAPGCINAVASTGSGEHNAGQDCLSCHGKVGGAPAWTLAGTLYSAASGGAAVSGATIEVIDANGKRLALRTYANGNFYTNAAVAFPVTVRASKCPSDQTMNEPLNVGSCNSCHNDTMRVHLP